MIKKAITILSTIVFFCFYNAGTNAFHGKINVREDPVKTILFVGNSLTYSNDLPKLVAGIGKDKGIVINTEMIAYPDYALEDHWNDGRLQTLIATKHYDFVVVQQGPSSQQEGRMMLLDYAARIKALCGKYNSRLAFFMVWPALSNF